jgi:PTH1 family peptidyl-tRNA hydrolase
VLAARDFYKLKQEELLVVCDDFHLPLARLRLRPQGSAGGQKGLADIIRRLGSEQFPRLRVGVGELPVGWDAADFVLSKFKKDELPEIDVAVGRAADAITLWAREGLAVAMNQFNA